MIKILIAEDEAVTMELTKHIFESAGGFEVLPGARNGEEVVDLVQKEKPDVVLMDINMPRMNGFDATREIMAIRAVPIVIFSASWNPQDVEITFQALQSGALAVLEKPTGPGAPNFERMVNELVQTVRLMAEVPVVTRHKKTIHSKGKRPPVTGVERMAHRARIVAIGTSTGGPPVLRTILSGLPVDFGAPVLVVQHISQGFLSGLTDWLDRSCSLHVGIAIHNEQLKPGHVYVAPDNLHLGVTGRGAIALGDSPPENMVRPAVSYMFRSVARVFGQSAVGVLLTGMGKDGAQELKLINDCGGVTIAQDQTSSAVFGMPGEAVKIGAAAHVLPPEDISNELRRLAPKQRKEAW